MTLEQADATTLEGAGTMAVQQLGNERTKAYADGADLVLERVFDAPRELVWRVMTDPARVTNWWGPHGYSTTVEEMDVRPGGRWRWINHTTGGESAPFKGEYLEVVPFERIVQTQIFQSSSSFTFLARQETFEDKTIRGEPCDAERGDDRTGTGNARDLESLRVCSAH